MKRALFILFTVTTFVFISFKFIQLYNERAYASQDRTHKLEQGGCLGLNYHRVRSSNLYNKAVTAITKSDELTEFSVYTNEFENELKRLQELNATFVTPENLIQYQKEGKFPERCVWISFDDVDRTVYDNAFPVLEKLDIPFTLYVIAGQVGSNNFQNFEMATWPQIQKMVDSGLATVGSHTYNMHILEGDEPIFLQKHEQQAFAKDLAQSKETIQDKLGINTIYFAYPFGNTTDEIAHIVKEAGFTQAAILAPAAITKDSDPFYINRIVTNPKTFKELILPWIEINHP
ncbi:polysaccharide deacetylase family protein [Bacillus sp. JZ8]